MFQQLARHAATSGSWYSGDNSILYHNNLKRLPPDWRWRTASIHYSFNSHGYRMKEWSEIDWDHYLLVLGCSYTLGLGLDLENMWWQQAANLTGRSIVNLAVEGTGPETVLTNLAAFLNECPRLPTQVVIQWPEISRKRLWDTRGHQHDLLIQAPVPRDLEAYYREYILNEPSQLNQFKDQQASARCLCRLAGSSYWEYSVGHLADDLRAIDFHNPTVYMACQTALRQSQNQSLATSSNPAILAYLNDLGRDMDATYQAHPGRYHNQQVFKHYCQQFNL